jgi:RNA polymerase sigma-70 factor (ECF subfamily)
MLNQSQSQPDLTHELVQHLEVMRRLARTLVRNEHVAEDVVQETMLAAVAQRPDPSAGLLVWLKAVLRRRVLLHFRTEQRRVVRELLLARENGDLAASIRNEAERAQATVERSAMLGAAIAGLEEPYQTVIVLRYFEDLPPREIARRLNRPVNTVTTQLQRGLQRLRTNLDARSGGDRRTWVCALLPQALQGRRGWWPKSVESFAGLSYGALTVGVALVLMVLSGVLLTAGRRGAEDDPLAGSGRKQIVTAYVPDDSPTHLDPAPTDAARIVRAASESAIAGANQAETSVKQPGELWVVVQSEFGRVPGARVLAQQESLLAPKFALIKSTIDGEDGLKLKVHSSGMRMRVQPDDHADLKRIEISTERDGTAVLPVLDGRSWSVRVEAAGFAPTLIKVRSEAAREEREVKLQPEARLVVERGGIPIELSLFCRLTGPFVDGLDVAALPRGEHALEMRNVAPGKYVLEVLTAGGVDVRQWYTPVRVVAEQVTRVDLSMGGRSRAQIQVLGHDAPAHFAQLSAPQIGTDPPSWARLAPIRRGLAEFDQLPAGPIVVRILSKECEIARSSFVAAEQVGVQHVSVAIEPGELRMLHAGSHGGELSFRLVRRSDDAHVDRQVRTKALEGDGVSRVVGLSPGPYRLWVTREGSVRRWDFEIDAGALELDVTAGGEPSDSVCALRVERGPGVIAAAPIELEHEPGLWLPLDDAREVLLLSPGTHRLRAPLHGLGHAVCEVEVPRASSTLFAEVAPARPIRVSVASGETEIELLVLPLDPPAVGRQHLGLPLQIGANGVGSVELRPGTYQVLDRAGRSATLRVGAEKTEAVIELDP